MHNKSSIFKNANPPVVGETYEILLKKKNVTIKRIISSSKIDQETMIQEDDEWFIVILGEATIMIENEKVVLKSGDYCTILRKTEHRVIDVKEGTIWLAVHIE